MRGNLINRLMERSAPTVPTVGMGATRLCYSDRKAGTIVAVAPRSGGRTYPRWVEFQRDKVTRADGGGMSDAQEYTYAPDPDGARARYTLRRNGRYVRHGDPMTGEALMIGHRSEYHDYSF